MNVHNLLSLFLMLCILPLELLAHTQAESNEMARLILLSGLCNEIDDLTEDETLPLSFTDWNGYIGGDDVDSGWTKRDKETALLNYMASQSTNDCKNLDGETKAMLRSGLHLMQAYQYTNAFTVISKWMTNPLADPIHRAYAIDMYYSWANISHEFLINTELLLTNTTWTSTSERCDVCWGVLETMHRGNTNSVVTGSRRSIVSMLYRARFLDASCAVPLDKLFVEEIPGYDTSSNRIGNITEWLSDSNITSFTSSYFLPITNRLLQSSVPLINLPDLPKLFP